MNLVRKHLELFGDNVIDMEPYIIAEAIHSEIPEAWERITAHYYRYGYVNDTLKYIPDEEESHYDGQRFKGYNRKKVKGKKKGKKKEDEPKDKT